MDRRLTRSDDRIIAGVVGGLAEFLHFDPSVLRLIVIILFFFTAIIPLLLIYIAAWIIIPER